MTVHTLPRRPLSGGRSSPALAWSPLSPTLVRRTWVRIADDVVQLGVVRPETPVTHRRAA